MQTIPPNCRFRFHVLSSEFGCPYKYTLKESLFISKIIPKCGLVIAVQWENLKL